MGPIKLHIRTKPLGFGHGVTAQLAVNLDFEREGYPASQAEALREGFTVETDDAERVLTLLTGLCQASQTLLKGDGLADALASSQTRKPRHD